MLKINDSETRNFLRIALAFAIVQIWNLKEKFLVDILSLGSKTLDPYIFADPILNADVN